MKYKVIDTRTNKDITDDCRWVITPDGKLYFLYCGLLIKYSIAKAIPVADDWDT